MLVNDSDLVPIQHDSRHSNVPQRNLLLLQFAFYLFFSSGSQVTVVFLANWDASTSNSSVRSLGLVRWRRLCLGNDKSKTQTPIFRVGRSQSAVTEHL